MVESTGFGEGTLFDPDGGEGTEGSCTCVADGCGCAGCNTQAGTEMIQAWQVAAGREAIA